MKRIRTPFKFVALTSALLLSPSALAFAAPSASPEARPTPHMTPGTPPPSAGATLNDPGVYTISGQNLTWNQRSGDFTIPSDVKFTQPGTDVTGDHATGNSITKSVKITGHVILHNAKPVSTIGITAKTASSEPQTLTSNELDVDGPTKNYTAIGDVKFTQGSKVVTAERGQLDQLKHMLVLNGNVHIDDTTTGQSMIADNVTYDTASETVTATGKAGAPFQIRAPVQTAPPGTPSPTKPPKKRR